MMQSYIPKRLIITPEADKMPMTAEILEKVTAINPNVEILYSQNQIPKLPTGISEPDKLTYLKETLLLCVRSKAAPFMEVFASPGKIVENIGIMGKVGFHCPLRCQPCYLNVAGRGTPWTRVYVDIDNFLFQTKKEVFVHTIALTLWKIISLVRKEQFNKVPPHFKQVIDNSVRTSILSTRNNIDSHDSAKKYLEKNLKKLLSEMEVELSEDDFSKMLKDIPQLYSESTKYPLSINISEYTDVGALEPYTGYVEKCLSYMDKNPYLNIRFRTRMPIFGALTQHTSLNRLSITVSMNTEKVMKEYFNSGFNINELIESTKELIAKGINVDIAIEPIIKYTGYEKEYVDLIKLIQKEIDLSKINSLKIGTVRYKTQLINSIRKYYPKTRLFETDQPLVEPVGGDRRWRYSLDERVKIYSLIINTLPKKYRNKIQLSSENPEIWERLGMDMKKVHKKTVRQYQPVKKRAI